MNQWEALASDFADRVAEMTGQHLDFTLASLAILDDLLDEWLHLSQVYRSERPDDLSRLVLPLVAYVGETLRHTYGGTWIERPSGPVLRIAQTIELDLRPLVQATLAQQHPPAFARLAAALDRELEDRLGE